MAEKIIIYWRDIPSQVTIRSGRKSAKRELPDRFIKAIDQCAMKSGADQTDDYLSEWRKGKPEEVGNDIEFEAEQAANELDKIYTTEKLKSLIEQGGHENAEK